MTPFLQRVLLLLNQKGISKNKVLTDLELGKNSFVNWDKRGNIPKGETLQKIADYFNVSVDYLLGITDDPQPPNAKVPAIEETAETLYKMLKDTVKHEPTELEIEKFTELVKVFFKDFGNKT